MVNIGCFLGHCRDVGYFQLTRECRARAKSSVMYSLLGSSSAREAKENNSTGATTYMRWLFLSISLKVTYDCR